jgi:hypothetical protein
MEETRLYQGQSIYFIGEKLPMIINAIGKNYAVCTRELNKRQDADLLKYQVEVGAYMSFTEAYNDLKDDIVYTCLDIANNTKGPHNMFSYDCDFRNQSDMYRLVTDLELGEIEISRRNSAYFKLDYEKTFPPIKWIYINKK